MTTSPASMRLITDYPEVVAWVQGIDQAAGPDAWVDFTVRKRRGKIDNVVVQCTLKMGAEQQKEKP